MSERLGLLDWGIGGLGIFRELRRRRPEVPVLYWSDTGATPYGRLSAPDLTARVSAVLRAMAGQGATQVIVGCNAASTILNELGEVPLPVMGVIAPAIAMVPPGLTGLLGIVGGARTIRSGLYRRALTTPKRRVIQRIAQPLSAHIEAGRGGTPAFARDLDRIVRPLKQATAILLACTHYPSAAEAFRRAAPGAALLDPAAAVVDQIAGWQLPTGADDRFVTTGRPADMRRAAWTAWGIDIAPRPAVGA